MTLLDAPKFDEARELRNRVMLYSGGGLLFVLIVVFWLASGHPATGPGTGGRTCGAVTRSTT